MGTSASKLSSLSNPPRQFVPGEFVVAWLTFKGDAVEDRDQRVVARKDGLLSSKLLHTLFGDDLIKCFEDAEGEHIPREMFVCTLVLCYEGNTEDRVTYLFTMYCIMYGLERESDGCILKQDYICLLEHLETIGVVPKKFYAAFEECGVSDNAMMLIDQFLEWVRRYPALLDFLAEHLPSAIGPSSPTSVRTSDDISGRMDVLTTSPSCRLDKEKSYGSFDFIGGEDSGDDSDDAYDSDQILYDLDDEFDDDMAGPDSRDGEDRGVSEGSDTAIPMEAAPTTPTGLQGASSPGAPQLRKRVRGLRQRSMQRMSKNISRTLGGGISKVGRSILHGGRNHTAAVGDSVLDATPAMLLNAGYAFSSASQVSKNFVCGYLHKLGDGKWSKRAWHRRWFVLDRQQGILSYYRHNPANLITASSRGNIVHMETEGNDDEPTVTKLARASSQNDAIAVNTTEDKPGRKSATSSPTALVKPTTSSAPSSSTNASAAVNPSSTPEKASPAPNMLYLNKGHPWFRSELDLNQDNVSLLFEKSLARNAPTRYHFQVSTLALQDIETKRGMQFKLCAENAEDFEQWTQAISEAINRRVQQRQSVRAAPVVSHQQMYRQRLLKEQQEKKDEQAVVSPTSAASASATSIARAEPVAAVGETKEVASDSKATPDTRRPSPPRIVTQFPVVPRSTISPWRLELKIEGGRPCLILGILLNFIALRCLPSEHVIWKAFVCAVVTGVFVMSARHSPSQELAPCSAMPITTIEKRASGACTSSHPEHCCLHKPSSATTILDASASALPHVRTSFTKYSLGVSMAQTEWIADGSTSKIPHSWAPTRAEAFVVRSLGYKKTKRKEPSEAALFEFLGADVFRTESKTDLLTQRVELPPEHAGAKLFVLNLQLPSYSPSVWGDARGDGPGYSLVLYWKIPTDVWSELDAPRRKVVHLLKRFLDAGNDVSVTDRFKLIVQVTNVDQCGVTGMAKKMLVSHNGTPLLTRPQHRIYRLDDGSTEVVIDVHEFCYIARRGLHMLLDKANRLVLDIAFVLQGETDDELPERILGCGRLNCLDSRVAQGLP